MKELASRLRSLLIQTSEVGLGYMTVHTPHRWPEDVPALEAVKPAASGGDATIGCTA